MNLARLFIKRPVATTLLTLAVGMVGFLGFMLLPVAPLPQVDFPTIRVQASLPGASPEVMAATVATPLERTLGRIAGVTEMTSQSSLGSTSIVLQFDLNRNIDGAARDVQAGINAAHSLLPTGMPSNPVWRKMNPADAPVLVMVLTSQTLGGGQLYDLASTIVAQRLSQVDGVGQVIVGGSSLPAVRVDIHPQSLAAQGVSLAQLRQTVTASNLDRPKGWLSGPKQQAVLQANDQAKHAVDYRDLVIGWHAGAAVRLSDVAQVSDGVEDARNAGMLNGHPAVVILAFRQPGANILKTVDAIKAQFPMLQDSLPAAASLKISMDRTPLIRSSLHDVEQSLLVSVILVILVVYVFLRDGHATLIPSITIPISLLGTCAVLYLGGYSLDTLSLMAMTVAAGFVVDDAIVVLENISRHVDEGLSPLQAAIRGAREVTFTVMAMSLSLIAVFLPILLMGGILGRLFREFAVTLSAAVLVSLLISLTATPTLASYWLKGSKTSTRSEDVSTPGLAWYRRTLPWALRHRRWVLFSLLLTVILTIVLFIHVPKGFMPVQDTGRLHGSLQADQDTSFAAMRSKMLLATKILKANPNVDVVLGFTGGSGGDARNSASFFISLKNKPQRRLSPDQVIDQLRPHLAAIRGGTLILQPVQDLRMGGKVSDALYQYALESNDLGLLRTWEPIVTAALRHLPQLQDVSSDAQDRGLQTHVEINRDTLARLGLNLAQVDDVLNSAYAQRQISVIYASKNQYHVVLGLPLAMQASSASFQDLYLPGNPGQVPLLAVARVTPSHTSLTVNHQDQFASSTLSFNLRAGASLSDANHAISEMLRSLHLPLAIHGGFQGTAKAFADDAAREPLLILAAILMVYIVLGILYESYIHPLTILSTLPSAGVGALLAMEIFHVQLTLISVIGLILLVGIVKKNAIMMIDFATQARRKGQSAETAIFDACMHRFRPIIMTTLAAFLGALPLALGWGGGGELRQPLGISIMGGLLISQLLTLYTTPVVYLTLEGWRRTDKGESA
ncbi:MAG: multidrug transporter subunit MdtC [Pseudomonadales bacterium]|nr:multidrug transporter subunit MdtC [Pseudomonadales bacterium]